MDRQRRDIPPEDRYEGGAGQSYRPGAVRQRSPPRGDSYRARSPPRRTDLYDSYGGPRQRSRSPPRRDDFRRRSPSPSRFHDRDIRGGDSYRGRMRSPVPATRREDLPRGDLFRREPEYNGREFRGDGPYRPERDYAGDRDRGYGAAAPSARSPPRYRDRSPVPLKRSRDPSPIGSRGRRTPPAKRERMQSPRGRYEDSYAPRAQSPPPRRYTPDPRDARAGPGEPSREFRPRSRSPVARNERILPREVDDYRKPLTPSSAPFGRPEHLTADESGRGSAATSRRSSPPVHPSRLPHVEDRSNRAGPRESYDSREPYREEPRRVALTPQRDREYADDRGYNTEDRIPPPRESYRSDDPPVQRTPPIGPAGFRASSSSMAPPTGPAGASAAYPRTPAAPPTGPPAGPRAGGPPREDFGTPRGRGGGYRGGRGSFEGGRGGYDGGRGGFEGSRGGFDGGRGGFEGGRGGYEGGRGGSGGARGGFDGGRGGLDGGRGSYDSSVPFRGGRGGSGFGGRGGGLPGPSFGRNESFDRDSDYNNGPPTGPSSAGPPAGPRGSFSNTPAQQPFRPSNNSTATTYPRTQRFAANGQPLPDDNPRSTSTPMTGVVPTGPRIARIHPAIADLPKPIEGGQKAEPLVDRMKLDKLQAEAEMLRKVIEEKEAKKRKTMREWEKLGRETEAAAFRSLVAEEGVRNASGEAEGTEAF